MISVFVVVFVMMCGSRLCRNSVFMIFRWYMLKMVLFCSISVFCLKVCFVLWMKLSFIWFVSVGLLFLGCFVFVGGIVGS